MELGSRRPRPNTAEIDRALAALNSSVPAIVRQLEEASRGGGGGSDGVGVGGHVEPRSDFWAHILDLHPCVVRACLNPESHNVLGRALRQVRDFVEGGDGQGTASGDTTYDRLLIHKLSEFLGLTSTSSDDKKSDVVALAADRQALDMDAVGAKLAQISRLMEYALKANKRVLRGDAREGVGGRVPPECSLALPTPRPRFLPPPEVQRWVTDQGMQPPIPASRPPAEPPRGLAFPQGPMGPPPPPPPPRQQSLLRLTAGVGTQKGIDYEPYFAAQSGSGPPRQQMLSPLSQQRPQALRLQEDLQLAQAQAQAQAEANLQLARYKAQLQQVQARLQASMQQLGATGFPTPLALSEPGPSLQTFQYPGYSPTPQLQPSLPLPDSLPGYPSGLQSADAGLALAAEFDSMTLRGAYGGGNPGANPRHIGGSRLHLPGPSALGLTGPTGVPQYPPGPSQAPPVPPAPPQGLQGGPAFASLMGRP